MTEPQRITVRQRRNDFHASLESGHWACGATIAEAVGDLVMSHPEQFMVTVEVKCK